LEQQWRTIFRLIAGRARYWLWDFQTLIVDNYATRAEALLSGVVLSTLRHAADADYRLLVAGDCCSDADEEVHRLLLEKVFPLQATITTAAGLA
jgi:hypothetical protein